MTKTTTKNAANSIVGKLTAGILATAAVLPAPALAQQPVSGERVLVVGDSLEVGSGPYLRRLLPGARVDAVKGRSSGQGVQVLGARLDPSVSVVVFPLGTNDSPSNPAGLAASFAAVRQLAGDRCVVVATIARRGVPVGGLNRVVAEFAESARAQVADWQTVVRSLPELLVSDGVHATGEGYGVRAGLLAEAVQACGTGGGGGATGATGLPAPRDPNAAPPEREAAPAALPSGVTAPLSALGTLGRAALRPVVSAVRAALITASKEGPEPVLGEP